MAEEKQDYLADRDVWVNADYSKVVDAGSPDAVHILAHAGQAVEHDSAARLGLMKPTKEGKPDPKSGTGPGKPDGTPK